MTIGKKDLINSYVECEMVTYNFIDGIFVMKSGEYSGTGLVEHLINVYGFERELFVSWVLEFILTYTDKVLDVFTTLYLGEFKLIRTHYGYQIDTGPIVGLVDEEELLDDCVNLLPQLKDRFKEDEIRKVLSIWLSKEKTNLIFTDY